MHLYQNNVVDAEDTHKKIAVTKMLLILHYSDNGEWKPILPTTKTALQSFNSATFTIITMVDVGEDTNLVHYYILVLILAKEQKTFPK